MFSSNKDIAFAPDVLFHEKKRETTLKSPHSLVSPVAFSSIPFQSFLSHHPTQGKAPRQSVLVVVPAGEPCPFPLELCKMTGTARPGPLGRRKGKERKQGGTQKNLQMDRSPPEIQVPITLLDLIYIISSAIYGLSDLGPLSLMCFQGNAIYESS